jgi:excisionase family DNA binding protein
MNESRNATEGAQRQPSGHRAALLDVRTVAQLLGCSPRHVYRLRNAGRMPVPIRLGSLIRWSRLVIEEWIASGCKPTRLPAGKEGMD